MLEVVAEVGSNFVTLEDCFKSIEAASIAGAHAVKFQLFTREELYGEPGEMSGVLPRAWLPTLATCARDEEIEFMCTAFSPDGYRYIDPYVKRHKVASSEITAIDILDVVNSLRKPVVLSTGGATMNDVHSALMVLRNVPVTLLYCEPCYPARVIDFRRMDQLREHYGSSCKIGYSDHSTDVLCIPQEAKRRGAVLIEKHVNLADVSGTPDAPHSINARELSLMCRHLKGKLSRDETFNPNPWKRQFIPLPNGKRGYFRRVS